KVLLPRQLDLLTGRGPRPPRHRDPPPENPILVEDREGGVRLRAHGYPEGVAAAGNLAPGYEDGVHIRPSVDRRAAEGAHRTEVYAHRFGKGYLGDPVHRSRAYVEADERPER